MSGESDVTVVTTLVCFFICTQGCGRIERPAFPAPFVSRAERTSTTRAKSRRGNAESRHCEERHVASPLPPARVSAWRGGVGGGGYRQVPLSLVCAETPHP